MKGSKGKGDFLHLLELEITNFLETHDDVLFLCLQICAMNGAISVQ
jgi:hypothetical protein